MTDRGSFQVSSQTLRTHATLWTEHATQAGTARTTIDAAVGQGVDLGYLAGLHGVEGYYNDWTNAMAKCLDDAKGTFTYIAAALNSVANDYDGVDSTSATSLKDLDPMNNVR